MRRIFSFVALCCALAAYAQAAPPRFVNLAANDLAWDPAGGRLWASVRGSGTYANAIVAIDPASGAIVNSVSLGGEAGPLAISHDSSALFAGVAADSAVYRIDLATLVVTGVFSLGSHPQLGSLTASDLAAQPGSNEVVAVARATSGGSAAGVAIVDASGLRPGVTANAHPALRIVFNATGDTLYGYDGARSSRELETIAVDALGASLLSEETLDNGDVFEGGWLFSRRGTAFDPATRRLAGSYQVPPPYGAQAVAVDGALGEVYLANFERIYAFSRSSFLPLGTLGAPGVTNVASFTRIGTRSFASIEAAPGLGIAIVDEPLTPDSDLDLAADDADNCPATPNAWQFDGDEDGIGDECDPEPGVDAIPGLHQCAAQFAANDATLVQLASQLGQLNAALAQADAQVTQCRAAADLDGDGEPNSTDRCANTAGRADEAGCSIEQFCAQLGRALCKRGDYLNDEPGVKKPRDCARTETACAPF